MTNEAKYSPCSYLGNGTTKDFPFSWKIFTEKDVIVTLENVSTEKQTIQKYGTDYNLTFSDVGGNVTFINAPTTDYKIIISRDVSEFQSTKYSTSPGFQSSEIEKSFDKVSCEIQEAYYTLNRAIKVKNGSTNLNLTVPEPEKNKTLVWNNEGTGLINSNLRIDELSGILQECREKANSAKISADNSKQSELNASGNAEIAIQNANSAKESADFAKETVDGFDTHTAEKQAEFDNNATQKQSTFDTNYNSKLNSFNSNASTLTTTFNNNVTSKTNTFNSNASSKQSAFDTNATNKTNTFNNNAAQKQSLVNQKANEAEIWAEGTDQQVAALGGTHSAKVWAEQNSEGLNVGMSNLSEVGEKKLEAQKSYHTGQVLTDEKGFQYTKTLAHSTFDINKFKVVGNLSITDDGIASGFSTQNFLKTVKMDYTKPFKVYTRIIVPRNIDTPILGGIFAFCGKNDYWNVLDISISSNQPDTFNIIYRKGSDNIKIDIYYLERDIYYDVMFEWNGTEYVVYYKKFNEVNYKKSRVYTNAEPIIPSEKASTSIDDQTLDIGFRVGSWYITGSIDLKYTGIEVISKEIFNGNKTGLDIIKHDDCEVVGSPTITEDGVASGFSQDSYLALLNIGQSLSSAEDWSIKFPITFGDDIQTRQEIFGGNIAAAPYSLIVRLWPTGKMIVVVNFTNTAGFSIESINTVAANTMYNVEVKVKNAVFYFYLNGILQGQHTVTENTFFTNALRIGTSHLLQYPFLGSIDLNAFKIYVDGDLVYQPCLKIPYTLSKTGSKIVPAYARNRVQDVYEQYGEALYYTIDEENNNYTLPIGEMYGMIGNNNGAPVYDNNKVVTVAENTDYPITQKGSVNVQLTSGTFTINGVELINETGNGLFPVNIGDVVKGTAGTMKFLPLKGV